MEDSRKRVERLIALRAAVDNPSEQADLGPEKIPSELFNPLVDGSSVSSGQGESNTTPRFDFYTDPMAAFSGARHSGNSSPGTPAANQIPKVHHHYFHNPRPYQHPRFYQPRFRAPSGSPYNHIPPLQQGFPQVRGGFGGTAACENHGERSFPSMWQHGNVIPASVPNSACNYRNNGVRAYVNQSGYHRNFNHQYRGGRGRGDSLLSDNFYHETMMEDPWQHMEPVPWKELDSQQNDTGLFNSGLPQSSSVKKPKVSGQSLAEYLASSFHEADKDKS